MTDAELTAYVNFCRTKVVATKVGPLHGWWDVIFDGEAALKGKRTICTRQEIEETLYGYVHSEALKHCKAACESRRIVLEERIANLEASLEYANAKV